MSEKETHITKSNNTRHKNTKAIVYSVNVCRILLAVTFLFSGFVKANDPLGTTYKLQDYLSSVGMTLPDNFLLGCSVILATFEFMLGTWLLFGISRKRTARLTGIFMFLMTMLTLYIAIADPVSDCGCFGDAIILSNWATFSKNIVLLAAAWWVNKHYRLSFDIVHESVKWLITLIAMCAIVGYAIYCIIYLPVIDFRPYKIGTDLRNSISLSGQKFDVKIVYERNGEYMELSAEDDDPDSTWTYVETRSVPIGETNDLKVADFYISTQDGEEITEDVVMDDGVTIMLIIPNLLNADEGCIDKVNNIYDWSQDKNISFYCITGSTEDKAYTYWQDHTGAEYQFYISEDRVLKTIVRGNPGLVLVNNGVIKKKWSNFNMPDITELSACISATGK